MVHLGFAFYTVLYLTLQGPVLSRVWVKHWSTQGEYRMGDTATLHCEIFSDKETIEYCDTEWAMLDPNNPDEIIKITESELYAGRVKVINNSTNTIITIRNLRLNDTAPLCIIDCFLDGELKRSVGRGGSLKIIHSRSSSGPEEEESSPSFTGLYYFLFAVNIIIFVVTVICSTILYKRHCTGNKW